MKPCLVKVGVIEPWEFPWESLAAEVQDGTDDCLLIKLREKIRYKNTDVVQLIAEPRSRDGSFDKIEGGQKIVICMTPIAAETLRSLEECIELAQKWRGWFLLGSAVVDQKARQHRLRSDL